MTYYAYYFALAAVIFIILFLLWDFNRPTTFATFFRDSSQFKYLWRQKEFRCKNLKDRGFLLDLNNRYHESGLDASLSEAEFARWLTL